MKVRMEGGTEGRKDEKRKDAETQLQMQTL